MRNASDGLSMPGTSRFARRWQRRRGHQRHDVESLTGFRDLLLRQQSVPQCSWSSTAAHQTTGISSRMTANRGSNAPSIGSLRIAASSKSEATSTTINEQTLVTRGSEALGHWNARSASGALRQDRRACNLRLGRAGCPVGFETLRRPVDMCRGRRGKSAKTASSAARRGSQIEIGCALSCVHGPASPI
jgi:hypothetical protein